jgi:acyl carrier protein
LYEWRRPTAFAASDGSVESIHDTERRVLMICREVFDRQDISAECDLWGLGMDSVSVTRLLSRMREMFGVELSHEMLFECSTVVGIAHALESPKPCSVPLYLPPSAVRKNGG